MFSWHTIPFARILLPFIIGIFTALYLPFGFLIPALLVVFLTGISLFFHLNKGIQFNFRYKIVSGISITLIVVVLGYFRAYLFNEAKQPAYFANISAAKYYQVTIDDAVIEKTRYYRCYTKVNTVLDSVGKQFHVNGTVLFYLKKGKLIQKPVIGNQYIVKATASAIPGPSNPGEFDYRQYLSYHNIYFQLFTDSSKAIHLPESQHSIYRTATLLRDKSLLILKKYIESPKELGVAEALLLGYKDDLDPDITAAFQRTGTLHVLAVSGLHAGIIYLILAFVTRPLTKKKYGKILQVVVLLLGIWLYAFVTGLSSSVLRASIMFSFMAIGKLLKYHVNIYNNIFSSAFILLLYNPLFIVDVGFQLSYLAVLGIVLIQPMIEKWYIPRYRLDKYIWGLISVSFAAQLLTFPIGVFYFHQFPNYFLLSNLLIIPITSLVLIFLIGLLALHIIPIAGLIIGKAILYMLQFNNWLVQGIDNLPFSYINGLNFNMLQMFLMYAILFLFLSFCIHRYKSLLYVMLIFIIFFSSYFAILRYNQHNQRILAVHHIKGHDVFTCLDGRKAIILADSGFLNNASGIRFFLEPYFWSHGISTISKHDLQKTFVATNISYVRKVGLQFYDRILTIDQPLTKNVYKNGIVILKDAKYDFFINLDSQLPNVKISTTISQAKKDIFRKQYFKLYKQKLKENESFILISF